MRLVIMSLFVLTQFVLGSELNQPYEYPVNTCLSCGEPLGDNPPVLIDGGRELKFCSLACVGSYAKAPETAIKNLEEIIRLSQRPTYPLDVCIVTGNKLGTMGEPIEWVYGNTLVKFCCGACIEKFEQDPEQFLNKLSVAPAAQPDQSGSK